VQPVISRRGPSTSLRIEFLRREISIHATEISTCASANASASVASLEMTKESHTNRMVRQQGWLIGKLANWLITPTLEITARAIPCPHTRAIHEHLRVLISDSVIQSSSQKDALVRGLNRHHKLTVADVCTPRVSDNIGMDTLIGVRAVAVPRRRDDARSPGRIHQAAPEGARRC